MDKVVSNRARYLETDGNLSFSGWFKVKNETTGETEVLPHRTQYVLEKRINQGESIWFSINMPVSSRNFSIDVRDGSEIATVDVSDGQAKAADGKTLWAAESVRKEVMPWLVPLSESGFTKPIVTRSEGRVVFVDKGPYHVYWSTSGFDGNLSFIDVRKGNQDLEGGASLQLQFDESPNRQILYFNHEGSVIGMHFDYSDIRKRAWAKPLVPPLGGPECNMYEDIQVTHDLDEISLGLLWELQGALNEAERVKIHVKLKDFGIGLIRRL